LEPPNANQMLKRNLYILYSVTIYCTSSSNERWGEVASTKNWPQLLCKCSIQNC